MSFQTENIGFSTVWKNYISIPGRILDTIAQFAKTSSLTEAVMSEDKNCGYFLKNMIPFSETREYSDRVVRYRYEVFKSKMIILKILLDSQDILSILEQDPEFTVKELNIASEKNYRVKKAIQDSLFKNSTQQNNHRIKRYVLFLNGQDQQDSSYVEMYQDLIFCLANQSDRDHQDIMIWILNNAKCQGREIARYRSCTEKYSKVVSVIIKNKNNINTQLIQLLLSGGASVRSQNNYSFRLASRYGHANVVKTMLRKGVDVHAINGSIQEASNRGHTETVKVLLNGKPDIHRNYDTALFLASKNGHTDIVKVLLKHGANVKSHNYAALRFASRNGHSSIVNILLKYGGDVHAGYDDALCGACEGGHVQP